MFTVTCKGAISNSVANFKGIKVTCSLIMSGVLKWQGCLNESSFKNTIFICNLFCLPHCYYFKEYTYVYSVKYWFSFCITFCVIWSVV